MLLATGRLFADALSGSTASAGAGLPLLLTRPNALLPEVVAVMKELGITSVHLGGDDRVETSTLIADWTIDVLGFDASKVALVRGDEAGEGADALTAGPFVSLTNHPLLLTESSTQPGDVLAAWLAAHPKLTGGFLIGGPGTWSVPPDSLPPGLELDEETGAMSGTADGPDPFEGYVPVAFTDEHGQSDTKDVLIVVLPTV